VKEYLHAFNNLAHYALEFVNTEAKKIACFQRGLSPMMLKTMDTGTRATFNSYISGCLRPVRPSCVRGLLRPVRLSLGHQWQGVSSIVLLPWVLDSNLHRDGIRGNQLNKSHTR